MSNYQKVLYNQKTKSLVVDDDPELELVPCELPVLVDIPSMLTWGLSSAYPNTLTMHVGNNTSHINLSNLNQEADIKRLDESIKAMNEHLNNMNTTTQLTLLKLVNIYSNNEIINLLKLLNSPDPEVKQLAQSTINSEFIAVIHAREKQDDD